MPPKKKSASGYKFAPPLPKGIILEDIAKKKWRLGVSIGKGGFGEIYSAQEFSEKGTKYPYVIKIEPHENGPLFVEINFYIRNAKVADVEGFKKENGLKTFGMPVYCGSGSHEYNGEKYRFLVIEKFGTDLLKLYTQNNKQFPINTVFKVGLQVLDVLKYMHSKGYIHGDIKAANLLMGESKETQNKQVFLVDFGLATKYSLDKAFKPNPNKAHDGTIEYLSRDAHFGVPTRRGDLEILAYNMLHWLGCKLPWENKIKDPKSVQNSKEESMSSVSNMINVCFGSTLHPKAIEDYLTYLSTLNFNTEPDYEKIKSIFMAGLKSAGGNLRSPFDFKISKTPSRATKTPTSGSRSSSRNKKVVNEEATTPKLARISKPKRGLAKSMEHIDDDMNQEEANNSLSEIDTDDESSPVVPTRRPKGRVQRKPREKVTKITDEDEINSGLSESEEDYVSSSPVASTSKRKIKKKQTKLTNGTVNGESVRKKNVTLGKRKSGQLSSISEQDSDNDNGTPTKRPARKAKVIGRSRNKALSKTNSDTELAHSDNEQATEKRRRIPTTKTKLKKGQAMSLNDLTEGYTDAMKEVLLKKQEKDKKKRK